MVETDFGIQNLLTYTVKQSMPYILRCLNSAREEGTIEASNKILLTIINSLWAVIWTIQIFVRPCLVSHSFVFYTISILHSYNILLDVLLCSIAKYSAIRHKNLLVRDLLCNTPNCYFSAGGFRGYFWSTLYLYATKHSWIIKPIASVNWTEDYKGTNTEWLRYTSIQFSLQPFVQEQAVVILFSTEIGLASKHSFSFQWILTTEPNDFFKSKNLTTVLKTSMIWKL